MRVYKGISQSSGFSDVIAEKVLSLVVVAIPGENGVFASSCDARDTSDGAMRQI